MAQGLLEQFPVLQVRAAAALALTGCGPGHHGGDLMSRAPQCVAESPGEASGAVRTESLRFVSSFPLSSLLA